MPNWVGDLLGPYGLTAFLLITMYVLGRIGWRLLREYINDLRAQRDKAEVLAATAIEGIKELTAAVKEYNTGLTTLRDAQDTRTQEAVAAVVKKVTQQLLESGR